MAPKSPELSRSTTKPKLLKRLSGGLSFSKKSRPTPDKAPPASSPVAAPDPHQVRYVLIELPVDGGQKFAWIVDDVEMVFTSPPGKSKGDQYEFKFSFGGGPVVDAPAAAPVPEPAAKVADELVTKAVSAAVEDKTALAAEVTTSAIDQAIEDSVAADVTTAAVEGAIVAAAPETLEALAKETVSDAVEGAMADVEPAASSLRSWQEDKPAASGNGLPLLMLVLAIAVGLAIYFDVASKFDELMAPPALPPPLPPKKFLGLF